MKQLLFVALAAFVFGHVSNAQTQAPQKSEYEKQLIKAGSSYTAKQYISSINALSRAKGEIDALIEQEIKKALPAKHGEWVLSYSGKEQKEVENTMEKVSDLFAFVRLYTIGEPKAETVITPTKPEVTPPDPSAPVKVDTTPVYAKQATQAPKIVMTISNYNPLALMVAKAHAPLTEENTLMTTASIETTKLMVKGNKAVVTYNKLSDYGDLIVSLGGSTVRLVGTNVKLETLKQLAEAVNYDILKKALQ